MSETVWACSQSDYEAAATALSVAMESHAQVRLRHNKEGYKALLNVSEFHDRCMDLARHFSEQRRIERPLA